MNLLPCSHPSRIIDQIDPAKDLLQNLDTMHPEVLEGNGLVPVDYHEGMVFRPAVESIRGTFVASSTLSREMMVEAVLRDMTRRRLIADVSYEGQWQHYDFFVKLRESPLKQACVDVIGGEGNSLNIPNRPAWAHEFLLWCHLDGAVVNQPSKGIGDILSNRIANGGVVRGKHVDAVLVKDALCGTRLRPCPKYRDHQRRNSTIAPDVYLLPRRLPRYPDDPSPDPHDEQSLELPFLILKSYGVKRSELSQHVYQVRMALFTKRTRGRDTLWVSTSVTHRSEVLAEQEERVRNPGSRLLKAAAVISPTSDRFSASSERKEWHTCLGV